MGIESTEYDFLLCGHLFGDMLWHIPYLEDCLKENEFTGIQTNAQNAWKSYSYAKIIEFGEIQKFSRLAEQARNSNNKCTVNCIFMQKINAQLYTLM